MDVSKFDRCYVYGGVVDLRKGAPGLNALIGGVDEDVLYWRPSEQGVRCYDR